MGIANEGVRAPVLAFALVLLLGLPTIAHGSRDVEVPEPSSPLVQDCPFTFETRPEPNRVVLQVIASRLHRWEEHDLSASDFCIVLLEPERAVLPRADASALLDASRLWTMQLPDRSWAEIVDVAEIDDLQVLTPYLSTDDGVTTNARATRPGSDAPAPPAFPRRPDLEPDAATPSVTPSSVQPQAVFGDDERVRVDPTEGYPWWVTSFQGMVFANGAHGRCTAFLVAPHTALTNGHCVFNSNYGGYVTSVSIAPGQRQASQDSTVERPFGEHAAVQWQTNATYAGLSGPYSWAHVEVDYAAVHFSQSFTDLGITTYMPLVFNVSPSAINMAGYPREVQGESNSFAMWHSYGEVVEVLERQLHHRADSSGGNSGGATWQFVAPDTRRVVALNAAESTSFNLGPRLVSENLDLIQTWLAWSPGARPGNDDVAEATRLAADTGTTGGSNLGATREPGEPDHCGYPGGASVWWSWIAPSEGRLRVDTAGSTFDVLLAVYTGSSIATLTERACDGSGGTANAVDVGVVAGTHYLIAVDGYAGASGSIQLNWSFEPTTIAAPLPPTGVLATAVSHERIDLVWSHASSGADRYWIEYLQGSCSGEFTALPPVDGSQTSFSHHGLSPDTRYCYVMLTELDGEYSGLSNVTDTWTLPAPPPEPTPPTNVTATAASHERIDLAWSHASSGADQYRLEYRQGSCSGSFSTLQVVTGSATSHAHTGLSAETRYCYRLVTLLGGQASSPSVTADAQTLPAPADPQVSARIAPVWSDCGAATAGSHCSLRIDLLDNGATYGGLEFGLYSTRFALVDVAARGIAADCVASAGPERIGVICSSGVDGSGQVLEVTVRRESDGDDTFETTDVTLVDLDGQTYRGQGADLFVTEFACDIAAFADRPLGDVNADGVVTTPDALLILRTVVGALPAPAPGSAEAYHGDLNSDGVISTADALLALQKGVDPTRPARLAVAPRALRLAPGESACLLIGNAGSLPLPALSVDAPTGVTVADITHAGAVGRVLQVSLVAGAGGEIVIDAGSAGSLTVGINP